MGTVGRDAVVAVGCRNATGFPAGDCRNPVVLERVSTPFGNKIALCFWPGATGFQAGVAQLMELFRAADSNKT